MLSLKNINDCVPTIQSQKCSLDTFSKPDQVAVSKPLSEIVSIESMAYIFTIINWTISLQGTQENWNQEVQKEPHDHQY